MTGAEVAAATLLSLPASTIIAAYLLDQLVLPLRPLACSSGSRWFITGAAAWFSLRRGSTREPGHRADLVLFVAVLAAVFAWLMWVARSLVSPSGQRNRPDAPPPAHRIHREALDARPRRGRRAVPRRDGALHARQPDPGRARRRGGAVRWPARRAHRGRGHCRAQGWTGRAHRAARAPAGDAAHPIRGAERCAAAGAIQLLRRLVHPRIVFSPRSSENASPSPCGGCWRHGTTRRRWG